MGKTPYYCRKLQTVFDDQVGTGAKNFLKRLSGSEHFGVLATSVTVPQRRWLAAMLSTRIVPSSSTSTAMGYSPDRVDALVWALTELMIEGGPQRKQLFV